MVAMKAALTLTITAAGLGATIAQASAAPPTTSNAGATARPTPGTVTPATAALIRAEEIAQCRPGELTLWPDGQDRPAAARQWHFVYRHEGAPLGIDRSRAVDMARRAAQAWLACGLALQVTDLPKGQTPPQDAVQILWSETGSRGNFGLANLAARSLSLGPGAFSVYLKRSGPAAAEPVLQMTLSHEMGHFLGLMAHSRRCVDVMSYYTVGAERCTVREPRTWGSVPEYRHVLPTACDLQRCRALNRLR